MPATSERRNSSLQSSSPGRRILSRITSPFTARSRNVPDFYVEADDPHKRYSPGDPITGSVIVKVAKAIRVTHIVVCLHGFVQVYKTPGSPPAEGFRAHNNLIGQGIGKKDGAYFGNGFATLFEDEAVICGDGRLDEGCYKFQFQMRFPQDTMPSSIDFERGTISYMLTATMTRPTSISPITYHDQKIFYAEHIDIARLLPPKPRTITLEPLVRHGRGRSTAKKKASQLDSTKLEEPGTPSTIHQSLSWSLPGTPVEERPPRSNSPSNHSSASQQSSNCQTSASGSYFQSQRASQNDNPLGGSKNRTITATVESLRGGCLRGDFIPVKVVVNHTKHIKSMQGVIVSLFRQARVDTHPALPLGPTSDGDKRRMEDYYPKSLTGLGGLSLSGAGSSHVFRKDLAQVIMPLIVDPNTLSAELTAKVRLPEDAFPTISCVPGNMISFRYYIEVILDIQGKLAGQERYFNQANSPSMTDSQYVAFGDLEGSQGGDRNVQGSFGTSIVDTAPIRRDKSVVTCVLEVIVGTRDSERVKGKGRAVNTPQTPLAECSSQESRVGPSCSQSAPILSTETSRMRQTDMTNVNIDAELRSTSNTSNTDEGLQFPAPPPFPSNDYEAMTEKDRLRHAEALLLPSHPPGAEQQFAQRAEPSAPILDDEPREDLEPAYPLEHDFEEHDGQPTQETLHDDGTGIEAQWSVMPPYGETIPHDARTRARPTTDDKHELHRRELEAQASAPIGTDGDIADGMPSPSAALAPEADQVATRDSLDAQDGDDCYTGGDHLPRYER